MYDRVLFPTDGSETATRAAPHAISHATRFDADLIVMSTHGRSGVGRFLMGSVTERVLRQSDVFVLAAHG